jgi:hypothetical protein
LAEQVVNVYVAIDVDELRAIAALKKYWPGFLRHSDITADAAGQKLLGALE